MNMKIRAKILIPTLLFVVLALPAILIPTIPNNQAAPSSDATYDTVPLDPLQWETNSEPSRTGQQVDPDELNQYLECFLGE